MFEAGVGAWYEGPALRRMLVVEKGLERWRPRRVWRASEVLYMIMGLFETKR